MGEVSHEKVLKTLVSLGLTRLDAKVYVLLAKIGPIKARDAAKTLRISKQRLYPAIKNLQSKGIVNSTLERPARFSAVQFEKMLDSLLKAKMEQARRIQQNKDELLSDWQSITIAESDSSPAKFTVIEGRSYVYSKIQQMIKDTREKLSFVATVPSLARADQFGLFDAAFNHPSRSKIRFRFLTELSGQNVNAMKALLKKKPNVDFNLEGRAPDLGLKLCPRMVIKDEEETVFFIDPVEGFPSEQDDVCLWTNCNSLVHGFLAMFEDLWRNATTIETKIIEVETGKPKPKMHIISDAKAAHKKYHETMRSAKEEIITTTSTEGLVALWKSMDLVSDWVKRGVSVKIMAPIISENLKAAQHLLKLCEVRHVPRGYLGTTIIDGKHLFQFEKPPIEQGKPEITEYFENVFYTNDLEYVEKMKNMLNTIWKNAYTPSSITLAAITKIDVPGVELPSNIEMTGATKRINGLRFVEDEKPLRKLTEKILLNKFINAKRTQVKDLSKDPVIFYCSAGQAVIHPPSTFNLPHLLFHIFHLNKKSSFGAEDAMIIMSRHETPSGYSYLPAAFITDNSEALVFWKNTFAGIPFEQQVVDKNEFHVQVQHNSLFAGWTVSIPLSQQGYILPPSCILIEGYGDVKTGKYSIGNPSGDTVVNEVNYFEAFVTFVHPSSKYSGPGTDGFFYREFFSTTYPPSTS